MLQTHRHILVSIFLTVICIHALLAFTGDGFAQEQKDDIPLKAPKDWSGETITLPPGFASDMKLRGIEVIRFAPGMFDPKAKVFFSYAFVFRVKAEQELPLKMIRSEIMTYYRGLAKAVGRGQIDTSGFALKLDARKANSEKPAAGISLYAGQLKWIEPFKTKMAQTLEMELDAWKGAKGKYNYLFACVSPADMKQDIWKQMRSIRTDFQKAVPAAAASSDKKTALASKEPVLEKQSAGHWPSFRGAGAVGVADDQDLPDQWDAANNKNIRWKTTIPGLAHSSPVVWGDHVFVTSDRQRRYQQQGGSHVQTRALRRRHSLGRSLVPSLCRDLYR